MVPHRTLIFFSTCDYNWWICDWWMYLGTWNMSYWEIINRCTNCVWTCFLWWIVVGGMRNTQIGGSPHVGYTRIQLFTVFVATIHLWKSSPSSSVRKTQTCPERVLFVVCDRQWNWLLLGQRPVLMKYLFCTRFERCTSWSIYFPNAIFVNLRTWLALITYCKYKPIVTKLMTL